MVVAWNDQSGQGGDTDGSIKAQIFEPVALEQNSYDLKGTIPQPMQSTGIKIQGGKHPLLDPSGVVPLDIEGFAPQQNPQSRRALAEN